MKPFHIINFILIFLLLVGICLAEELVVSNSLRDIQARSMEIEVLVDQNKTLKNIDIVLEIDNLEDNWNNYESKLCYMGNHKNIQEIGQEIAKLKKYVASDDVDSAKVSLYSIKFYCHSYLHFMGANLHNVL